MKRKPLRNCAVCHRPISEQRPIYLMVDSTQEIRGPLHAGCAERVHLDRERELTWRELHTDEFGRVIPSVVQSDLGLDAAPDQEASS